MSAWMRAGWGVVALAWGVGSWAEAGSISGAGYLSGGTRQQIASLYDYGWPVFNADASTPRVSLTATMNWGTNPFANMLVPIPSNLQANGPKVVFNKIGTGGAQ